MDESNQLLVGKGEEDDSGWELPGGGFEHDESIEECLNRELNEELGAKIKSIGKVSFIYRGKSVHGWTILRIAIPVKLKNYDFKYGDMKAAKFVNKDELMALNFAADEGTIKDYANYIWPPGN